MRGREESVDTYLDNDDITSASKKLGISEMSWYPHLFLASENSDAFVKQYAASVRCVERCFWHTKVKK